MQRFLFHWYFINFMGCSIVHFLVMTYSWSIYFPFIIWVIHTSERIFNSIFLNSLEVKLFQLIKLQLQLLVKKLRKFSLVLTDDKVRTSFCLAILQWNQNFVFCSKLEFINLNLVLHLTWVFLDFELRVVFKTLSKAVGKVKPSLHLWSCDLDLIKLFRMTI